MPDLGPGQARIEYEGHNLTIEIQQGSVDRDILTDMIRRYANSYGLQKLLTARIIRLRYVRDDPKFTGRNINWLWSVVPLRRSQS